MKNSARDTAYGRSRPLVTSSLTARWKKWTLVGILILAAALRLSVLSRGDTLTDEALYAFRAVGPMDFDEAEAQTTPLEWFDPSTSSRLHQDFGGPAGQADLSQASSRRTQIPWWTSFSFHDHPPLVFWAQHAFIKIFGETNFAFRLPSVILGLLSIWLLYLIGRKLYSEEAGLFAAFLLGITVNHVYISRAGLQETYVIFFLLLASYFFLRSLEQDKYLIWTGAALGLGFLAKYTVFVFVPVFIVYLAFVKREYFFNKKLWLAVILSFVIFSPVIIYNLMLYRAVGHFDFQLSYIAGQNPEVWKVAPGKEIGALTDRVRNFAPNLARSNSWLFLSVFLLSLLGFLWSAARHPLEAFKKHRFLILAFFFLLLLIVRIGPSFRFLSMLPPFLALTSAALLAVHVNIRCQHRMLTSKWGNAAVWGIFGIVAAFEIFYSINSQITYYPKGPELWAYSELRYENANWGYNELAKFLAVELKGKMPAIAFESKYRFIARIQEKAFKSQSAAGLQEYPALIVYDSNIQSAAQLWVLDRLHIYHGWPIIKTEVYVQFLRERGFDYFEKSGFKTRYFIIPTDKVPLKAPPKLTGLGAAFEKELINNRISSLSIKNKRGEEAFRVYKF